MYLSSVEQVHRCDSKEAVNPQHREKLGRHHWAVRPSSTYLTYAESLSRIFGDSQNWLCVAENKALTSFYVRRS